VIRRDFLKTGIVLVGGLVVLGSLGEVPAQAHVRPPGVIDESKFLAACNRCGRCLDACPTQGLTTVSLLDPRSSGSPTLSGYCRVFDEVSIPPYPGGNDELKSGAIPGTPCLKCVYACPTGALKVLDIRQAKMGLAIIDKSTCLGWVSGTCNRCFDTCPVNAVVESVQYQPVVDGTKCIGCAQCTYVCPTSPKSVIVNPLGRT
jgi:ferredoxin-type protein NapG